MSYIAAVVPRIRAVILRNREGFISQNILDDINYEFVYSLVRCDGSGHDRNIFSDVKTKGLPL